MTDNVFERREKKYLVDAEQRSAIERAARGRAVPDAYGRTLITSVYLDTPDRSLIARSLEKPRYKEKLRLRAYGEAAGEALVMLCRNGSSAVRDDALVALPVYFELKKKFEGIVYKRRVRLSLPAAWAFAHGASFEAARTTFPLIEANCSEWDDAGATGPMSPRTGASPLLHPLSSERDMGPVAPAASQRAYLDRQIARELEAALARYEGLRPSAAILCWRTAWEPAEPEGGPRLTFDDALSFIDLMREGALARPIIAPDEAILELKAGASLPTWLVETLGDARVFPRSFSKYGEAARIMAAASGDALAAAVAHGPGSCRRGHVRRSSGGRSHPARVPAPVRMLKKGAR